MARVSGMLRILPLLLLVAELAAGAGSYSIDFCTYIGGERLDMARDVEMDRQGNIYITGGTDSSSFPTTPGAYDRTFNGLVDTFVTKLNPSGKLIWSTYLGGPKYDRAYAIEVDEAGYVYVGGRGGAGYPTTPGVVQETFGGTASVRVSSPPGGGFSSEAVKLAFAGGLKDMLFDAGKAELSRRTGTELDKVKDKLPPGLPGGLGNVIPGLGGKTDDKPEDEKD
jgi:hypothetical protein